MNSLSCSVLQLAPPDVTMQAEPGALPRWMKKATTSEAVVIGVIALKSALKRQAMAISGDQAMFSTLH